MPSKFCLALASFVLLIAACCVVAEEPAAPAVVDHSRLMVYWMADGQEHPVRTAADWAVRRRQIIVGMERAMGKLPDRSHLPPLEVKVVERLERDGFTRLGITYVGADNARIPAHLYLPKNRRAGQRGAAMLALHQTSSRGKKEVSGEDGGPANQAYGKELAERGYVVLAPDYPSFGDYFPDFHKSRFASGSMMGVFNHMRGVDLLQMRAEVDPARIGAIGHSLGGHNAMFVGAFDQRLKVIVSSCGWTPTHDYYGGKLAGWAQDRYMPRIRDVYGLDADRVPFDFCEVVAAFAPRAFFSNSPLGDSNFDVVGVKKAEPKAREIYALLGTGDRLQIRYPRCDHDFPPAIRREAYAFIDWILGHKPSRDVPE
jgi:dienelactone hydrolase